MNYLTRHIVLYTILLLVLLRPPAIVWSAEKGVIPLLRDELQSLANERLEAKGSEVLKILLRLTDALPGSEFADDEMRQVVARAAMVIHHAGMEETVLDPDVPGRGLYIWARWALTAHDINPVSALSAIEAYRHAVPDGLINNEQDAARAGRILDVLSGYLTALGYREPATAIQLRAVAAAYCAGSDFLYAGDYEQRLIRLGGIPPVYPQDESISAYLARIAPMPDLSEVEKSLRTLAASPLTSETVLDVPLSGVLSLLNERISDEKPWGYKQDNTTAIRFIYRPDQYAYATRSYNDSVPVPLENIFIRTLRVAGPFNAWLPDADWQLAWNADRNYYELTVPNHQIEYEGEIPFKFIINGYYWVEPPEACPNAIRDEAFGALNLMLRLEP